MLFACFLFLPSFCFLFLFYLFAFLSHKAPLLSPFPFLSLSLSLPPSFPPPPLSFSLFLSLSPSPLSSSLCALLSETNRNFMPQTTSFQKNTSNHLVRVKEQRKGIPHPHAFCQTCSFNLLTPCHFALRAFPLLFQCSQLWRSSPPTMTSMRKTLPGSKPSTKLQR